MKRIAVSMLFLSLFSQPILAQRTQPKRAQSESSERTVVSDADLVAAQRRDFVIATVIALAKEATSFSDSALRPRVLARAADILWDADNINARALFLRAWEAAEKGDEEEVTLKTKDNPPPMVTALRRASGHDLRSEVLGFVAKRDRKLADEFLAKLKSETERKAGSSNSTRPVDSWSASEADSKRLEVARQLLSQGLVQDALEVASPALYHVNSKSVTFLSELRARNAEAADQRFSVLLSRAALDPSADANTISGLSSYLFSPGFYITFRPEGGATWTQPEQPLTPPNVRASIRDKFFQIGATILLQRLPPPEQDSSSSGRIGTVNVIRRLLPFFEQYAPDTAMALRSYLTELTGPSGSDTRTNQNPLLTQGIREDEPSDVRRDLQDRIDHAKTSRQRDLIYTTAAVTLATSGDVQAREVADKIEDAARRSEVRQFVDFQFVQLAIKRKDASEAVRLSEAGELSHSQRAYAYTQAAGVLMDSQRKRSLELLAKAIDETNRIESGTIDRPVLLVGIAIQLSTIDRSRGWEIMSRTAQAANVSEDFNGENWIRFAMPSTSGTKSVGVGGANFSLFSLFQLLAKDDLYRSVETAKSFRNDAPRATSTLAIASAILSEKRN